jgi:thiol-disulfide isomerase/thioredoxin
MNRVQRRHAAAKPAPSSRRSLIMYGSLALVAVIIIAAVAFASRVPKAASDAPIYAKLTTGQDAPAFDVSTTAGRFDSTKPDGKPTLLEVFAAWCPHCQAETSVLNQLYGKYGSKVNFVAVSGSNVAMDGDSAETQADVVDFAKRFDVKYPIAYDANLDVAKKYLQGGFPTIVIINKSNKIASVDDGEIDEATLAKRLNSVL